MRADDIIRDLSERQHGVIHRRQLREAGIARATILRHIAGGDLELVSSQVVRRRGTPFTDASRDLAAVLDAGPGAALSHWSAARVWGLPVGKIAERAHVTGPRARTRRHDPLGEIHEPRSLLVGHLTQLNAIPITTPARTLFDIANLRRVHPELLERLLDAALRSRLTTLGRLERVLGELPTRGRRGRAEMRRLIRERRGGLTPVESSLEFRFNALAREAGFAALARQVDVGDGQDWRGRVDFLDRSLRLVIEIDGEFSHSSLGDQRRDAERQQSLQAGGWTVVRFSEVDVWHRGSHVVAELRELRRLLRRDQLAG